MRAMGQQWGGPFLRYVCAPVIKEKGVKGLNYVLLGKGFFCSERKAGQMCKFWASGGKMEGTR